MTLLPEKKDNIRIVVVDDEPAMREVMALILRDYDVVEASNGYEAIKRCKERTPDIILMDIMMPRMNGIEATKTILREHPDVKIVAITAYATHKGKEMLDAGAIEILEKPFGRKKLEDIIKRLSNGEMARNKSRV